MDNYTILVGNFKILLSKTGHSGEQSVRKQKFELYVSWSSTNRNENISSNSRSRIDILLKFTKSMP